MSSKQADVGLVPADWAVEELRAFCSLITYGFTNPMPDATEGPWKLTAKDVIDGRINYGTARRTTQDAFDRLTDKSRPRVGDVLLTKDGSIGRVAVVDRDGLCINQSVALIRPNDRISSDFLKYLLFSPHYQKVMEGDSDGSTIKHIYITRVDKMQVAVPPMEEQKRILAVVKSIDDRITLLRETNTTFEAIAQALFKSWFVDFDPIHAKMQGRAPEGMDEATAALFPYSFEESELGAVPKGWRVGSVEDLCSTITNGGTPSRSKTVFWDGGSIPWFKTGEFHDGFLLKASEFITGVALNGSSVKLLPKDSVLMAIYAAPTVGRLGILTEPGTFNQACTGMFAKADIGPWFLFWTLFNGRDWFNSRANGAAQQNISKAIVAAYRVVVPGNSLLAAFNNSAQSLHDSIRLNSEKAHTLSALRDTLLPRLISGQLQLPDVGQLSESLA